MSALGPFQVRHPVLRMKAIERETAELIGALPELDMLLTLRFSVVAYRGQAMTNVTTLSARDVLRAPTKDRTVIATALRLAADRLAPEAIA